MTISEKNASLSESLNICVKSKEQRQDAKSEDGAILQDRRDSSVKVSAIFDL